MSEKNRNSTAGSENRPRDRKVGAAAPAAAGKDTSAREGQDSQAAETPGKAGPEGSPPASAPKPKVTPTTRITARVVPADKTPGNGTKPAKSGATPGKDASGTGLQFSNPSSDPPARRGLKPDPEKVRRARQESQLKKPESAPASRRTAASASTAEAEKSDAAMPPESEQQTGIPAAARLSGAIKPTRPTNQRLFRRHRRGLSVAVGLLIAVGVVWWSGAFQKRTDLANTSDPAEIAEPAALETAAARPNDEEVRNETAKLLSDLGLFTSSTDGKSDEVLKAAIRDYQAMAGLPVNGEPSYDLLMDLRAVASAIGTE